MALGRGRNQFIDGKKAFDAWILTGDMEKAAQYLADQGLKHPTTGRTYSTTGIHRAATKYYIENPAVSYEYFKTVNPDLVDKGKFDAFIMTKARKNLRITSRVGVWYWGQTKTVADPNLSYIQRYPKTFAKWIAVPEDSLNEPPKQMVDSDHYSVDS